MAGFETIPEGQGSREGRGVDAAGAPRRGTVFLGYLGRNPRSWYPAVGEAMEVEFFVMLPRLGAFDVTLRVADDHEVQ